ncbi:prolipoprotein diacylglyceryl transferase [Planctomycetota bacterium]
MHSTILQLGPFVIRSYTLMLSIAFLAGTLLAVRRARKHVIPPHEVVNFAVLIIIASIVGSRLLYVFEHLETFSQHPEAMFFIWQGGLSFHGGLFLALIAAWWWLNNKKISIGRMLDIFVPAMALGFFFVRIGCFLNGCCFGTPTDASWGVVFPSDSPAGWVFKDTAIHPTQLYSSFLGLISFFILLVIERKMQLDDRNGLLFLFFLVLFALWRFILEFFRYQGHNAITVAWFTEAQIYSVGILILSVTIITQIFRKKLNDDILGKQA